MDTTSSEKPKSKFLNWFVRIMLMIIGILILIVVYDRNRSNNSPTGFSIPLTQSPEQLRQELLSKERQNPTAYISQQGTWHKNLIGETIIEGTISNSATLAEFKDVILEITSVSETNTDISTNRYAVYQYFEPGKSNPYKLTIKTPSETKQLRIGVITATPAN